MIVPNFWGILFLFVFHSVSLYILFPSRYSKVKTAAILCGLFITSFGFCWVTVQKSVDFSSLLFVLIVAVVLAVAVALLISAYDIPKTLFLFLLYAQAFIIAMTLSAFISQRLFDGDSLSVLLIRTVLHIGIVFLCAVLRSKFRILVQGVISGWWPLNFVEILCFIYTGIFVLRVFDRPYGTTELVSFILFLLIMIAVYIVFFNTMGYMYGAAKQQKTELQSKFLLEQMRLMQESMEKTRRLWHDARHHNLQIMEYVKNGETDALLSYLGEYEEYAKSQSSVRICGNLAGNSILCAYARKAAQNGVTVYFDVVLEQEVGISDIDVVAILANLMENAINGCIISKAPEPSINVYIGQRIGKLVIYISNTAKENLILENGLPYSKDGIGISSILHSAARYGGEYDFQSQNGIFSCKLLLKITDKSLG